MARITVLHYYLNDCIACKLFVNFLIILFGTNPFFQAVTPLQLTSKLTHLISHYLIFLQVHAIVHCHPELTSYLYQFVQVFQNKSFFLPSNVQSEEGLFILLAFLKILVYMHSLWTNSSHTCPFNLDLVHASYTYAFSIFFHQCKLNHKIRT